MTNFKNSLHDHWQKWPHLYWNEHWGNGSTWHPYLGRQSQQNGSIMTSILWWDTINLLSESGKKSYLSSCFTTLCILGCEEEWEEFVHNDRVRHLLCKMLDLFFLQHLLPHLSFSYGLQILRYWFLMKCTYKPGIISPQLPLPWFQKEHLVQRLLETYVRAEKQEMSPRIPLTAENNCSLLDFTPIPEVYHFRLVGVVVFRQIFTVVSFLSYSLLWLFQNVTLSTPTTSLPRVSR